jgi:MarR family transcriptional regulator, temperature-dependent positive regulator of motility
LIVLDFDSDRMPGQLARRFQQIASAAFIAEIEAAGYDLTPVQFAALVALGKNPGIDQITLAGLIAYDRTTIAGVVDRLVSKGYVERKVSESDRRARILHLTKAGEQTLAAVKPAVVAAQHLMLSGLSETETSDLIALLHKAVSAANHVSRAPKLT